MPRAHKMAAGLFALAPLLCPGAAAAARTAPIAFTPAHLLRHVRDTTVTSDNWAGYVAVGGPFTGVSGTWVQPAIKCSSGDQYSSYWVGLDGFNSPTVEQTGTEADCDGRTAEYSAWYELYPAYPVTYSNVVKPGDHMAASVVFSGTDTYTFTVQDVTAGWTKTTAKASAGDERSSAECIVEAPYSGGVLPLADFGTFTFGSCEVDGLPINSFTPITIQMTTSSGSPEATTSALSGGGFSVTWNS
jgi:Peptidase A4 family